MVPICSRLVAFGSRLVLSAWPCPATASPAPTGSTFPTFPAPIPRRVFTAHRDGLGSQQVRVNIVPPLERGQSEWPGYWMLQPRVPRAPHRGAAHRRPGRIDTVSVGVLKGVRKVYLPTTIDCHSRHAWPGSLPQ
jgi:hypothetical protein